MLFHSLTKRWVWAGSLVACCVLGAAPPARAADKTCAQTVGAARARRLFRHCENVNTSTHNPCILETPCADTAAFTVQWCSNIEKDPPAWCQEQKDPAINALVGSELDQARLFARTISLDLTQAEAAQAKASKASAQVVATQSKLKEAAATYQKHLADFAKALSARTAALAQYRSAEAKPGAAGLVEKRQSLQAQLHALADSATALGKEQGQVEALNGLLSQSTSDTRTARDSASDALTDVQDAKAIIAPLLAHLTKSAPKPAPGKPAPPTSDLAAPARALLDQVTREEASTKAAAALASTERKKVEALAASGPSSPSAQAQLTKSAQKLSKDGATASELVFQIDHIVQRAADRHRSDAPSAKRAHCEIEKVDFANFDYRGSVPTIRKGKAAGKDYANNPEAASLDGVEFSDLNADGKKEAIVFLNLPNMGPHGDAAGEIHFFEVDSQCLVQEIDQFGGGVTPGAAKGKIYTYRDTAYTGSPGLAGNFPDGHVEVQVQYVNEQLVETKRKRIPEQ